MPGYYYGFPNPRKNKQLDYLKICHFWDVITDSIRLTGYSRVSGSEGEPR
jgi:hypothetical protein